jgi:hypothetical protein
MMGLMGIRALAYSPFQSEPLSMMIARCDPTDLRVDL